MKQPQAPCKGCDKSGKLHKRCELYLQYKKDWQEWKDLCDLERSVDQYRYASVARHGEEYRKRMHVDKNNKIRR